MRRDGLFYSCVACAAGHAAATPRPRVPAPREQSPLGRAETLRLPEPAHLVARLAAAGIDLIVVGLVLAFLLSHTDDETVVLLAMLGVPAMYDALFVMHTGQTLGKSMLGIQVVSANGGPVSVGQACGRGVLKAGQLACCGIPLLALAFTPRRRGLHDLLASTCVTPVGDGAPRPAA